MVIKHVYLSSKGKLSELVRAKSHATRLGTSRGQSSRFTLYKRTVIATQSNAQPQLESLQLLLPRRYHIDAVYVFTYPNVIKGQILNHVFVLRYVNRNHWYQKTTCMQASIYLNIYIHGIHMTSNDLCFGCLTPNFKGQTFQNKVLNSAPGIYVLTDLCDWTQASS